MTWFAGTALLFVVCCLVMFRFGHAMSEPVVVYPFIAAWGVSALAWPLFAMLAFRALRDR
ncbi:hypothetical protein NED98_19805 [Sphingomonas sp. MMSM20]|uniref:hypothetical protein n=1 Tax=Sphingomonas lycopersici TaxID=2951807 RepID=UPI00223705CB|nr:hypothetical protein [Sphingomonas lycopersici]MCW6532500.1 hypothetical protein [Sphingomonas lycopersici]